MPNWGLNSIISPTNSSKKQYVNIYMHKEKVYHTSIEKDDLRRKALHQQTSNENLVEAQGQLHNLMVMNVKP